MDLFADCVSNETSRNVSETVKLTFSDFWTAYPKRLGANPRAMAEKKFCAAIKSGIDPERIVNSAKAYGDELRAQRKIGTEFVAQAVTWLNQKRYEDYAPDPGGTERQARMDEFMATKGFYWIAGRWQKK